MPGHCADTRALLQIARETLPALQELKRQGLVRHIGITGLPLRIYRALLSQIQDATLDVCLSYCHYCLNDSSLLELLPELEARGLGVINASCLSMGLLTAGGPPEWHPAPEELKAAARRAAEVCGHRGHDISRLALMWAVRVRRAARSAVRLDGGFAASACRIRAAPPPEATVAPLLDVFTVRSRSASSGARTCVDVPVWSCVEGGAWHVQEPRLASTLVGMASRELVQRNVQAVLQALECAPNPAHAAEMQTLEEVQRILEPVRNLTWASGLPENN